MPLDAKKELLFQAIVLTLPTVYSKLIKNYFTNMEAAKLSKGLNDFVIYLGSSLSILTTEELIFHSTQQI